MDRDTAFAAQLIWDKMCPLIPDREFTQEEKIRIIISGAILFHYSHDPVPLLAVAFALRRYFKEYGDIPIVSTVDLLIGGFES